MCTKISSPFDLCEMVSVPCGIAGQLDRSPNRITCLWSLKSGVRQRGSLTIQNSSAEPVTPVQPGRTRTLRHVVRVASGNFLEMYDFQVFGYYAVAIAATFFPSGNEFASLMLSLATFGAGFLMRPLGAIVLGAYIDHRQRRDGLLLTLGLMVIGIVSIACTPAYARIGLIAAPAGRRGSAGAGTVGRGRSGRHLRLSLRGWDPGHKETQPPFASENARMCQGKEPMIIFHQGMLSPISKMSFPARRGDQVCRPDGQGDSRRRENRGR